MFSARHFRVMLLASVTSLSLMPAAGSDLVTTSPTGARNEALVQALLVMAARDWPAAVAELGRHVDRSSADWNALFGRALQQGRLAPAAEYRSYFDAALRLNPGHFGALMFEAESDLAACDLAAAQAKLQRLGNACENACAEFDALAASIASYREATCRAPAAGADATAASGPVPR